MIAIGSLNDGLEMVVYGLSYAIGITGIVLISGQTISYLNAPFIICIANRLKDLIGRIDHSL